MRKHVRTREGKINAPELGCEDVGWKVVTGGSNRQGGMLAGLRTPAHTFTAAKMRILPLAVGREVEIAHETCRRPESMRASPGMIACMGASQRFVFEDAAPRGT